MKPNLARDLNRFYSLLAELATAPWQGKPLTDLPTRNQLPARGVYFFREAGEFRRGDEKTLRIVRVGTHGVSLNSKSTLRARLKAHLGTRAGHGNHRGSIFRLHLGHALRAGGKSAPTTWGMGSSRPEDVRNNPKAIAAELKWEQLVSDYIGAMPILWIEVPVVG